MRVRVDWFEISGGIVRDRELTPMRTSDTMIGFYRKGKPSVATERV